MVYPKNPKLFTLFQFYLAMKEMTPGPNTQSYKCLRRVL